MFSRVGQTFLRIKKGVPSQALRFKHQPRNLLLLGERGGLVSSSFPPDKSAKFVQFMEESSRVVYAGFDPTSDSLHIGNLLVVMGLLQAQRSGHQPIALIGGATAKIGDPSGKDTERPKLSDDAIEKNILGIKTNLDRIFHHHEKYFWNKEGDSKLKPLTILNNQSWYQNVNLVHFLRDYGRHFRMGKMLAKESVERRISSENGLSFTEFSYQIFQAFDWLHLYRELDCSIQIGGTDQLGNIVCGFDLIQRVVGRKSPDVYGILLPLMTTDSGDKFGKSGSSPVWLSQERMSPFEFYQFFLRLPDSKVAEMLHFFTFLSLSEVKDLISSHQRNPDKRKAQKKIAESLTLLVHGEEGLELAKKATSILYNDDNALTTLSTTTHEELNNIFNQAPYTRLLFSEGITVLQLAMKIGCFRTDRDAIRIIDAGGFYINQHRHTNTDEIIVSHIHILPNKLSLVRVGKKNFYIVEWTHS